MNYLNLNIIVGALILHSSLCFAANSEGSGLRGGGDLSLDRQAKIKNYIDTSLKDDLKAFIKAIKVDKVQDAAGRKLLSELFKGRKFVEEIEKREYETANECTDSAGTTKDVSTVYGNNSVPICFNLVSLAKKNASKREIVELAFHDHAHKLGYEPAKLEHTLAEYLTPDVIVMAAATDVEGGIERPLVLPTQDISNSSPLNPPIPGVSDNSSSYGRLSGALTGFALDRQAMALATIKAYDEFVQNWIRGQLTRSSGGVMRIDLDNTVYSAAHVSNNSRSSYQVDNSGSQIAYLKALNSATQNVGLGVVSVGFNTTISNSEEAGNFWSGPSAGHSSTMRAYAFVGTTPGGEVQVANRTFRILTYAQSIETVGRIYELSLKALETKFASELRQRNIFPQTSEYFREISRLFNQANVEFSLTIFENKDAQDRFLAYLSKLSEKAHAMESLGKDSINNLRVPEVESGPVTLIELLLNRGSDYSTYPGTGSRSNSGVRVMCESLDPYLGMCHGMCREMCTAINPNMGAGVNAMCMSLPTNMCAGNCRRACVAR